MIRTRAAEVLSSREICSVMERKTDLHCDGQEARPILTKSGSANEVNGDSDFKTIHDASWWPQAVRDGNLNALKSAIDLKPSGLRWQDKCGQTLLHVAAISNKVDVINFFVSLQFDVNAQDECGYTPLHEAVCAAQVDAIHALISAGCDVHARTNCGYCAVILAAEMNQVESLEALLVHKDVVSPNVVDCRGCTPLHHAAAKNQPECISVLLKHGADPCVKNSACLTASNVAAYTGSMDALRTLFDYCLSKGRNVGDFLNASDSEGNLVLHAAVDSGSLEAVKVCLQYGANIDTQQDDQSTPVHFAALRGELKILQAMFDAQPQRKNSALVLTDKNGMTALHKAVLFDSVDVAQFLLDEGAALDVPDVNEHTPLLLAALKSSMKCILMLLKRGADMDHTDKDGRNFMHLAVLNNAQIDRILSQMSNVSHFHKLFNNKDYFGCTPLHYASIQGHLAAADDLLNSGARLHIPTHNKTTAIHLAAQNGHYKTCKKLLDSLEGSRIINLTDYKGLTALHHAAMNGHTKIVHLLLENGAIFHKGYCGNSPFAMATIGGHVKTMKLLLTCHPYLLNMACKTGNTALHQAGAYGHSDVTEFLLSEGAEIKLNDAGQTFLDIALKRRNKDVCAVAMKHERWREVLSTLSPTYPSPIFGLIEEFPEICFEVLERCVTDNNKPPSCEDFAVTYDFTFLELSRPTVYSDCQKSIPLDWNSLDRVRAPTIADVKKSESRSNALRMDANNVSNQCNATNVQEQQPPNTEKFRCIIKGSLPVINHMVKFGRVDLLVSPLCTEYMNMKWNKYARLHVLASNFAHLFAVVVLIVTVCVAPPVIQCSLLINKNCDEWQNTTCVEEHRQSELCATPPPFRVCLILLLAFVINRLMADGAFFVSNSCRISFDLEILLVALVITSLAIFVVPCLTWSGNMVVSMYQWNFLAIAAASECLAFMVNMRVIGAVGLYVVMFIEILKTLLKTASVFGILLLGFALAFSVVFQIPINEDSDYDEYLAGLSYAHPLLSAMRVMVMATGELELRETILAGLINPNLKKALPFPVTTGILFAFFIVLVTVALLNLIVGLAIGDIKVVRSNATLNRFCIQSKYFTIMENHLYLTGFKKCIGNPRPEKITQYPNSRRSIISRLIHQLETAVDMGRPKAIDQAVESTKRSQFQESVSKQLEKHKQRFKKIASSLEKQAELVEHIVNKLEIKLEKRRNRDEGHTNCSKCDELKSTKARSTVDWQKLYEKLRAKKTCDSIGVPISFEENSALLNCGDRVPENKERKSTITSYITRKAK